MGWQFIIFCSFEIFRNETTFFVEQNMFQQFFCHFQLEYYTSLSHLKLNFICILDKYQSQFGTGSQMFSYYHEEDESSFQLVDTSRPQRPLYQRNRNRFGQVSYEDQSLYRGWCQEWEWILGLQQIYLQWVLTCIGIIWFKAVLLPVANC